ncbi:hypothetical protein ACLKA6_000129 [Drosophila palustris]
MAGKNKQQNKSRIDVFENEERIRLIEEVRERPIIWDLTDKKHFDATFIKSARESIAEALNKPVQDCKSAWRSLRDSYKYHIKASEKKRAKSGSAGGVGPQPPMANEAVEWHLAPYMAFLPELSMQRRTYCSALDDVPSTSQGIIPEGSNWDLQFEANASMDASQASYVEDGLDASNTSCENTSAYSYERASKRAKVDKTGSKEVFSQIHTLIDKQVEMLSVARSGALPAALYWSDIIRGFEPEMARRATNAVTQMLLNFENAISNNVTPQTSTFGPSEH